jgi:hypothetical protein
MVTSAQICRFKRQVDWGCLLMGPAENGVRSANNTSAGVICGTVVIETGSQSNNDVTVSDDSSIVIY